MVKSDENEREKKPPATHEERVGQGAPVRGARGVADGRSDETPENHRENQSASPYYERVWHNQRWGIEAQVSISPEGFRAGIQCNSWLLFISKSLYYVLFWGNFLFIADWKAQLAFAFFTVMRGMLAKLEASQLPPDRSLGEQDATRGSQPQDAKKRSKR